MPIKKFLQICLLMILAAACTACGTKMIRGEPPIVRMSDLSQAGENVSIQLSMRNINGVALDIRSIDFKLSAEDETLYTYQGPVDTNIAANGTETLAVTLADNANGRQLLKNLQNGDIKSLPYSLEGSVKSADEGILHFQHEGHMYPVPGRPGHFR